MISFGPTRPGPKTAAPRTTLAPLSFCSGTGRPTSTPTSQPGELGTSRISCLVSFLKGHAGSRGCGPRGPRRSQLSGLPRFGRAPRAGELPGEPTPGGTRRDRGRVRHRNEGCGGLPRSQPALAGDAVRWCGHQRPRRHPELDRGLQRLAPLGPGGVFRCHLRYLRRYLPRLVASGWPLPIVCLLPDEDLAHPAGQAPMMARLAAFVEWVAARPPELTDSGGLRPADTGGSSCRCSVSPPSQPRRRVATWRTCRVGETIREKMAGDIETLFEKLADFGVAE